MMTETEMFYARDDGTRRGDPAPMALRGYALGIAQMAGFTTCASSACTLMTIPYTSDNAAPAAVSQSPATLGESRGPKAARRMRRRPVVLLLIVALILAPAVGWGTYAAVSW